MTTFPPGTGPLPDPEADGFREAEIAAEAARREQVEADTAQRSADYKAFYSGETDTPPWEPPPEGLLRSAGTST